MKTIFPLTHKFTLHKIKYALNVNTTKYVKIVMGNSDLYFCNVCISKLPTLKVYFKGTYKHTVWRSSFFFFFFFNYSKVINPEEELYKDMLLTESSAVWVSLIRLYLQHSSLWSHGMYVHGNHTQFANNMPYHNQLTLCVCILSGS